MKLSFSLLLLMLVIPVTTQAESPVKVMTFNIRYDGGKRELPGPETPWIAASGKHRRDLVLDVIESTDADIIGLQEALEHQARAVCERMKAHRCYSVGRIDGKQAGEHCTLLYRADRFELVDEGTFWLCETPNKPGSKHPDAACERISSWIRLTDKQNDNRQLLVVNMHWDHKGQQAREFAAQSVMDFLAKQQGDAELIVMGDTNSHPDNKAIQTMVSDSRVPLVDCYRAVHTRPAEDELTFNGFEGDTKGTPIDYIFATKGLQPTSAEIVRTSFNGVYPSDHYPVVVDLTFKK